MKFSGWGSSLSVKIHFQTNERWSSMLLSTSKKHLNPAINYRAVRYAVAESIGELGNKPGGRR
jgi:hypothetical protein